MTQVRIPQNQKTSPRLDVDKMAAEKNIEVLKAVTANNDEEQLYRLMDTFTVQIILQKTDKIEENAVMASRIALNLLPRLLHHVRYEGPPEALNQFPPSHQAKVNQSTGDDWPPDLTLVFGKHASKDYVNPIYVSSAGWSIYISKEKPCTWSATNHCNHVAAMFAGALATGEVFKHMVGSFVNTDKITSKFEYDLVTHGTAEQPVLEPSIPGTIHLDNLALVGCGAIGQAFIVALAWATSLTGNILLIDHEKTDPSNEQRYLLAFPENRGTMKTSLLNNAITKSGSPVAIQEVPLKYEQFVGAIPSPVKFTEVIAVVDNRETRVNIQASLPKIIWNAWTETGSKSLSYGLGCHVIGNQYECIACSYFPKEASPTARKMASIRTGFSEEEIDERQEKNDVVTQEDIEKIAKNTGVPLQNLLPNKEKPFKELLHGDCGVFRMQMPQTHVVTPAPHVPILAGIMAASQVILSRIKRLPDNAKLMESCADFNALATPNADCVIRRERNNACFCSDPDYLKVYEEKHAGHEAQIFR